ncbi:MAG: glycosyltransferase family 2 protein [Bifidobacterium sp.]
MVSIVVPVYKAERFLDECIRSIAGQTYSNLEIILADDASPLTNAHGYVTSGLKA